MAGYIGSKAVVVSSGAERKKSFAITTTTTILTGLSYTPNQVHVFHNGVRLVEGTDFTAANGTSLTLNSAAQSGDEVVVVSYATFQVADTVSKSAGGTFDNDLGVTGSLTVSANVGIGTDTPAVPLDVNGRIRTDGGTNFLDLYHTGTSAYLETTGGAATPIGFATNGLERMQITASGKIGIGDTPSGWSVNVNALELDGQAADYLAFNSNAAGYIYQNAYYNGFNNTRKNAGPAAAYGLASGEHIFFIGPSGAAGESVTFNQGMRINGYGHIDTPFQPVISGQMGTAMVDPVAPQLLAFNQFWTSVGITFNDVTRRFTVPSAGKYRITLNPFFKAGTGVGRVLVGINNDTPIQSNAYGMTYKGGAEYDTGCIDSIVSLSANDYIVFRLFEGGLYNISADRFNQFTIQKIA
jgi:hypothetical protein